MENDSTDPVRLELAGYETTGYEMTGNHYRKAGNKGNVVQCQCFVKSVKDNRGHHASLGNKPPQP